MVYSSLLPSLFILLSQLLRQPLPFKRHLVGGCSGNKLLLTKFSPVV